MIVLGISIDVRLLLYGFSWSLIPGLVLGAALIGLGIHRMRLTLMQRSGS